MILIKEIKFELIDIQDPMICWIIEELRYKEIYVEESLARVKTLKVPRTKINVDEVLSYVQIEEMGEEIIERTRTWYEEVKQKSVESINLVIDKPIPEESY